MGRAATAGFAGRRRGPGVLGLAVAVVVGGCTTAGPAPAPVVTTPVAPATSAAPTARTGAAPDFDGDGGADLVVGTGTRPGRVGIRYANGASADLERQDVDPAHADSADFGQALLARDLNGDGYTDLVISDPGVELGLTLFLLYGGPGGLDLAGPVTLTSDSPGAGHALALVAAPTPVLAVGGANEAVLTWPIGEDGRPGAGPATLDPSSLGLPAPAPGGRFGTSLASDGSLLVVGAPGETVNGARQAGAVYLVDFAKDPLQAQRVTEDTPGVPDDAQAQDRFGAALAADDGWLVVGVPGEDRKDESGHNQPRTGMIVGFGLSGGTIASAQAYDQRWAPGTVEAGDGFGSSLAMARPCKDTAGVLVGAWAEAVGARAQAGAVWLVPLGDAAACGYVRLHDGDGLAERARAGTAVGSAVSALRVGAAGDTLVIAAQGDSEEGVPGRVLTLDYPYTDPPVEVLKDLAVAEERTIALSPPGG
ncbi:MAG: VCBS repeat-containing protein [Propionibacteriaceae bacterium]|nr:VCBS repeat-containing protein [Propionibacteriaceae bacterium]